MAIKKLCIFGRCNSFILKKKILFLIFLIPIYRFLSLHKDNRIIKFNIRIYHNEKSIFFTSGLYGYQNRLF